MIDAAVAAVARWRRRRHSAERQRRLAQPVISIGNLSTGGRAKTPMAERVARELISSGERPSILSRGYARERSTDAVVVVRDAGGVRARLAESGDEPLMLAERLDGAIVVVHADRARAGAAAAAHGATVHVLDDGFQHLRLARDIDIVMLHPSDLDDRVVPAGRLRESLSALASAHAIVLIDGADAPRAAARARVAALSSAAVFQARRQVAAPDADLAHARALLVAGIADPEQLSHAVRAAGWTTAGERTFRDHHRYSRRDAEEIARAAQAAQATFVLTTAKDAVRLREVWRSALPLRVAELSIDIDAPEAFRAWLLESVAHARAARESQMTARRRDGARRAS